MASKRAGLAGTPLVRVASRTRSLVAALQDTSGGEGLLSVAVDALIDNPSNPVRRSATSQATQQLARSLAQVGVIQPLIVVAAADFVGEFPQHAETVGDTGWVILAGHERRAAARIAGLDVVPVVVRSATRAGEVLLHENLHRDELTPIEEAEAFAREMAQQGLTQRQMGQHAGVSQGHINKRLQLLKLPAGLQDRVASGELAPAPAVELVKEYDADVLSHLADTFSDTTWPVEAKARHARDEVLSTKRIAAGRARAEVEGVAFVHDPFIAFTHNEFRHELSTTQDIEAARGRGDLVFGPGRVGHQDPIAYRRSAPEQEQQSQFEVARRKDTADRTAGMTARRAFLVTLARSRASKSDQLRVAVAATMAGLSLNAQVTRLARKVAQDGGLGPCGTGQDREWRTSLATVKTAAPRAQLAWVINLAALENHAAVNNHHGGWGPTTRGYLRFLIERGYEPLPWETAALQAAEKDDSSGIIGEPNADSTGITGATEGLS